MRYDMPRFYNQANNFFLSSASPADVLIPVHGVLAFHDLFVEHSCPTSRNSLPLRRK